MTEYILQNDILELRIKDFGAELFSIYNKQTDTQYLWNANPDYWKRHSPILFPFVGSLKNKAYSYQGKIYPSLQHGFARDMMFSLLKSTEDELWFTLHSSEETKKLYPFDFTLELGYRLEGRKISVLWNVANNGTSTMHFSIGGHPAFRCPLHASEKQSDCFIAFDTAKPLHYCQLDESGLLDKQALHNLHTENGVLPIDPNMFDRDALIFEDHQCHKVSLLNPDKQPYLTVTFDAPLFGLWSPAGKKAPFVCIEPWYGRCDSNDFGGTLENREHGNSLEPDASFKASYQITIES